jgi:hypothetical protein
LVLARADERTWRARLLASEVDIVVALGPSPPEEAWLGAHPELFEPIVRSTDGVSAVYRVLREKLR